MAVYTGVHIFSFGVHIIHWHICEQNIHAHKMIVFRDIFYHLNMCICACVCECVTCERPEDGIRALELVTEVMTCPMWVLNEQQPLEPTFQPCF